MGIVLSIAGKFLFGGLSFLKDLVAWVFKLVVTYPKASIAVLAVAVSAYFLYDYSYARGYEAKAKIDKVTIDFLQEKVNHYEDQIRKQNALIAYLESESANAADKNAQTVKVLKDKLEVMVINYKLAVENAEKWKSAYANRQVFVVESEGKKIEVRVQDGKVVCDRFYDEYVTTVNSVVDEANKSMKGDK